MSDEWTIEQHISGRSAEVRALYDRFIEVAEGCGPFTYAVSKSAITLKGTRRGFAGAALADAQLRVYLDLMRALPDDRRITRTDSYGRRLFVHHIRISSLDELDQTFAQWMGEAYEVGRGMHLAGPPVR